NGTIAKHEVGCTVRADDRPLARRLKDRALVCTRGHLEHEPLHERVIARRLLQWRRRPGHLGARWIAPIQPQNSVTTAAARAPCPKGSSAATDRRARPCKMTRVIPSPTSAPPAAIAITPTIRRVSASLASCSVLV